MASRSRHPPHRRHLWNLRRLRAILALLSCQLVLVGVLAACGGNERILTPSVASPPRIDQTPPPRPSPPAAQPFAPRAVTPATPTGPPGGLAAPRLTPPEGPRDTRIGLLLPLSGKPGAIGQAMLDAALLALFDLDEKGLRLLPRDTGGTPEGAAAAADALLQEGVELILGPLLADSVSAVTPRAGARGINVVAFSNDRTVAAPGVYLLSFPPDAEVARIVEFAVGRALTRFAVLAPRNRYGELAVEALSGAVRRGGAQLVDTVFYDSGDGAEDAVKRISRYQVRRQALRQKQDELRRIGGASAIRELKALEKRDTLGELDYDALLLPDGGDALRQVAPLLPYYDVDPGRVRMLGTGLWHDPRNLREPALAGGWFAGRDPERGAVFAQRFEAIYGRPPHSRASLAYDAVALAVGLARQPGPARFDARSLTAAHGFRGIDGLFRFAPDGRVQRGFTILEIAKDGFQVVGEPPQVFEDLIN